MTLFDQDDRENAPRRYFGKYAGIVVAEPGSDNETADRIARGEVWVQIPGIAEETPDGKGTRPYEALAAPCFPPGCYLVPEPGTHVWVEFGAGDINHPIWTGVWYPEVEVPKTYSGAAPSTVQRVLRTPSGRVQVILDGTNDAEKIIVSVCIDDNHTQVISVDAKSGKITIKGTDVEIAADKSLTLKAEKALVLTGNPIKLNGENLVVEKV